MFFKKKLKYARCGLQVQVDASKKKKLSPIIAAVSKLLPKEEHRNVNVTGVASATNSEGTIAFYMSGIGPQKAKKAAKDELRIVHANDELEDLGALGVLALLRWLESGKVQADYKHATVDAINRALDLLNVDRHLRLAHDGTCPSPLSHPNRAPGKGARVTN